MFDYSKVRGRIKEKGYSEKAAAVAIGITANSMSYKLNGKTSFKIKEIVKLCDLLKLNLNDIGPYFFAEKVWESKHSA